MAVVIGAAPTRRPGRSLSSTQIIRKVALFGCHAASLKDAPWDDPSWEKWGHASSRFAYRVEMDRYFDLHPKACWTRGGRKTSTYPKWLKANTVPIYMQRVHPDVPASVEFPRRRILQEFSEPRPYFTNQAAWMIALALTEGVSHIGLWGIEYGIEGEYMIQRASCEAWIMRAAERGVRVILPEQCTLLGQPAGLYGYDSHDPVTGKRTDEYERKEWKKEEQIVPIQPGTTPPPLAEPPAKLRDDIAAEEIDYPRPDWALGPLGGNGQAKEA